MKGTITIIQRRQWHPTPVLLPGKSHGRRSLVGCSPWGHEELDMTERLHFHISLLCIGEGNGNPLQCFCLENPRDGVAQSRTRLKWLGSSSSITIISWGRHEGHVDLGTGTTVIISFIGLIIWMLGMSCHALFQAIFPTWGSNPCPLRLLHCRWIPYPCRATWEAPNNC